MSALGGNFAPFTAGGQPWRLVTAMFLHYGVVHIGMNMVCLYQIALVEGALGRAEFLALYLVSGMIGGLTSLATHPLAVSAGASGAVFGMFGAFTGLMVVRRKQVEPGPWQRTMRSLASFFVLNLALGLSQTAIDLSAHVGGLVTGFAGGWALAKVPRLTATHSAWRALAVAFLGAAITFGGLRLLVR
jgi:rhomboid protease GluP